MLISLVWSQCETWPISKIIEKVICIYIYVHIYKAFYVVYFMQDLSVHHSCAIIRVAFWLLFNPYLYYVLYQKCLHIIFLVLDFIHVGKGLRWACPICRKVEVDIFKLFKIIRRGFLEIAKNSKVINKRVKKHEEAFKSFKCISYPDSPNKKPGSRKVAKK